MTMTMASSTSEGVHPLLLPEIILLLRSLLSTEDLRQAILVCRSWYSIFLPKLWHTVRADARHKDSSLIYNTNHLDSLETHTQLVRSLDIVLKDPPAMRKIDEPEVKEAHERLNSILVQCRGLTHLNTNLLHEVPFKVLWNNRETIVSFGLSSTVNDHYMLHRLWYVLSDDVGTDCMRNLRHLTLRNVKIHGESGHPGLHSAFLKLCQRLESLECNRCSMKSWRTPLLSTSKKGKNDDVDDTQPTWTLKQVKLMKVMNFLSFHVHFLQRCTSSLERLTWYSRSGQPLDPEFLQFLSQSRLKFLSLDGLILPDESLAELMEHLPPTLSTLYLSPRFQLVEMGPLFVAAAVAVSSRGVSIRSLLPWAADLTSVLVQRLFSTCDFIHFDYSLYVDAVDLLGAPWVMTRLVKLRLTINDVINLRTAMSSTHSDSDSGGLERVIYEQLSRLVSLEDLTLGEGLDIDFSGVDRSSWIDFSLRQGMGELATLKRLRHLDISRLEGLKMGADEGKWICDHWPVLEQLAVRSFHREITSHDFLMTYLHENRPRLRITQD
ncbi:hypothetical protein B0O80DRAFT_484140 [Mortierella sp. GBAus27b]|nr:hypothetical protein B0O80DRAFT_484140 [Mortierella sp. GBAus27b]